MKVTSRDILDRENRYIIFFTSYLFNCGNESVTYLQSFDNQEKTHLQCSRAHLTIPIFLFNRVLREAKASIENELAQLRLRNDNLSTQIAHLQQSALNITNDKNSVISELRAELKMKSFELTTLGVSFEVRVSILCLSFLC